MANKQFVNGATPLQLNLIKIVSEYLKNPPKDRKGRKSLSMMMLEAGYSKAMASKPCAAFRSEAVSSALIPIIDRIMDKRDKALEYITDDKLRVSSARDLTYVVSELTKNHQLLGGKPTENINNLYNGEQIKNIADRLANNRGTGSDGTTPSS